MAFVDTGLAAETEQEKDIFPVIWYNVHNTVGPHRFTAYRKDDVLLVQLFLREVADKSAPSEKLALDGVFGKITKKWINWYQSLNQVVLTCDGEVSQAKKLLTRGWKFYSIVLLNQHFFKKDSFWHENLATDPRTPPELREALQRPGPSNPYGDTFKRW